MASKETLIAVTVSLIPDDPEAFSAWCKEQGCYQLNGDRRAWCPAFQSYLRGAVGIASTPSGEQFLVYEEDFDDGE